MSKFSKFMKENKVSKINEKYAPTKSLVDEKGNPIEWEFKHITSKENENLRDSCTIDTPVKGKPNVFRQKMKSAKYLAVLICESVVFPDLFDVELQNSYNVKTPEDLLFSMVDDPGEYDRLSAFVYQFQGLSKGLDEKVDEAKN